MLELSDDDLYTFYIGHGVRAEASGDKPVGLNLSVAQRVGSLIHVVCAPVSFQPLVRFRDGPLSAVKQEGLYFGSVHFSGGQKKRSAFKATEPAGTRPRYSAKRSQSLPA